MVGTQRQAYAGFWISQQFRHLQNTFTRQNDLTCFRQTRDFCNTGRQTVAVGSNSAQTVSGNFHQHTVQVVTNVLLRHGKA